MTLPNTTLELLKLAAKAAGMNLGAWKAHENGLWAYAGLHDDTVVQWNPRTDDGDGAKLESKLNLDIHWAEAYVSVGRHNDPFAMFAVAYFADHAGDRQAARRTASFLAAAKIGKALP